MNHIGRCPICKEIFTNPVLHAPCQQTFDRKCLKGVCPTKTCQKVLRDNDLIPNPICKQMVELLYYPSQQTIYHLILLDTSTSMQYSDHWLPFLFGKSRFTLAIQFIENFLRSKKKKREEKFALVTFDVAQTLRFDFETIDTKHLRILPLIKPNGEKTALFDALSFAEKMVDDLRVQCKDESLPVHLIVLTDGGNNFGRDPDSSYLATDHKERAKRLHINGYILQIGNTNLNASRRLSEKLNFGFKYIHESKIDEFTKCFSDELSRENKTLRVDPTIINLPDVPHHVVGSSPALAELCT